MPKIIIVHTAPATYTMFPERIRQAVPGARVDNMLDEFMISDTLEKGDFTQNNLNRLYLMLHSADLAGADVIFVACSSLTPRVEMLRPLIKTPIITVDGSMLKKAVTQGTTITILVNSPTSIGPTTLGLQNEAAKIGKKIELDTVVCRDAYDALMRGDRAEHDRLVTAKAAEIKNRDVIVLAQASVAPLEQPIHKATGILTLSSPDLAIADIKAFFNL